MSLVIELSVFLLGAAAVAVALIYGAMALSRQFPSRAGGAWHRRYTLAMATGAAIGALAGVCFTFVLMAMGGGLPTPWNYLACPIGGLVGGLVLGLAIVVAVAVVHGAWWLATARRAKTSPVVPDEFV
jgi:hypothetical protein